MQSFTKFVTTVLQGSFGSYQRSYPLGAAPVVVSGSFDSAPRPIPFKQILVSVIASAVVGTATVAGVHAARDYAAPLVTTPPSTSATASAVGTATPAPTPQPAPTNTPAATPTVTAKAKACTPSSVPAASATTSGKAPGIYTNVSSPSYYSVYGNSLDQVRNQILSCGPNVGGGRRYAAVTSYAASWSFAHTPVAGDANTCTISNPVFVMNVTQGLPTYQNDAAPASVKTAWGKFISGLTTHENGHTALDVATARDIYTKLQNYPAMSCIDIHNSATAMIKAELAKLNAQNSNYDNDTNHGETQGSVL